MKVLADGTYLAELAPPRKKDGPPLTVRVIEYTMHTAPEDGGDGHEETSELFCLVTSLLDPEEYPALDLACCYPRRWRTAAAGIPLGHDQLPACSGRRDRHRRGFIPLSTRISLLPRSWLRSSPPPPSLATPGPGQPPKDQEIRRLPARKPGEPSVTTVIRKIQFHLLSPWQIA